jgi:hypothetical protein
MSESKFSHSAYFMHQGSRIIIIEYINLIVAIVGLAKKLIT